MLIPYDKTSSNTMCVNISSNTLYLTIREPLGLHFLSFKLMNLISIKPLLLCASQVELYVCIIIPRIYFQTLEFTQLGVSANLPN
jgi:hypothetical protein